MSLRLVLCPAPLQVKENKRYAAAPDFTISEVAAKVAADVGKIDIVVSASRPDTPPHPSA
jgi:hypothetical protein